MTMYQAPKNITVNNATATLGEGLRAIENGQKEIDLSAVIAVDSSAVATLLAWQRAAKKEGHSLTFKNMPGNLKSLVDLYSIDGLLHH
jgi:phospholipid transport system transporter-binding protein